MTLNTNTSRGYDEKSTCLLWSANAIKAPLMRVELLILNETCLNTCTEQNDIFPKGFGLSNVQMSRY